MRIGRTLRLQKEELHQRSGQNLSGCGRTQFGGRPGSPATGPCRWGGRRGFQPPHNANRIKRALAPDETSTNFTKPPAVRKEEAENQ
jgi:hypothetical protein